MLTARRRRFSQRPSAMHATLQGISRTHIDILLQLRLPHHYYLIGDCVTLDECIAWFMLLPESQHHLYEIHAAPQSDLVSAILSTEHIVELARLRDFLG